MIYTTLKNLVKKIPFLWILLTWSKDRVLILLRLKDVLIMMILFHIWPEQTYRFATRKTLPSKKNRFSRGSKQIIPYDLLKSKSSNIPMMEEINVVGIGSSFDLNNLKDLKGPIFHPGWGVLRTDKNGKVFYRHHHSYDNKITVDVEELFNDEVNKDLKHITYVIGRRSGIELFKKNNNNVLAVNAYGTDKDGNHYPLSDDWETSSYLDLFDHGAFVVHHLRQDRVSVRETTHLLAHLATEALTSLRKRDAAALSDDGAVGTHSCVAGALLAIDLSGGAPDHATALRTRARLALVSVNDHVGLLQQCASDLGSAKRGFVDFDGIHFGAALVVDRKFNHRLITLPGLLARFRRSLRASVDIDAGQRLTQVLGVVTNEWFRRPTGVAAFSISAVSLCQLPPVPLLSACKASRVS